MQTAFPPADGTPFLAALCMAAMLTFGACGKDQSGSAGEVPEKPAATSFDYDSLGRYHRPASQAPRADIPSTPAPDRLVHRDIRLGQGETVEAGDVTVVNYVAYHYATKKRYDSSYTLKTTPYRVVPGQGDFIRGFENGIVGMRVGGRRQVTIPPRLAYGDEGYNEQVEPGETLVFVIDLEALEKR